MTMRRIAFVGVLVALLVCGVSAQNLQLPESVTAGSGISIPTSGSGSATLYLYGPGTAIKRKVELGSSISIDGDQLKAAGRYTVILKGGEGASGSFFVVPGKLQKIAFLARPSRVPTSRPGAISGSAYLFDAYTNLVLTPTPVKFDLSVEGGKPITRTQTSKDGIAWVQLDSGKKAGAAQFVVSAGTDDVKRVVQQTASDPCNLRMHAQPNKNGNILLQTDPVKDCSGNPVPDGTIVTFSVVDSTGRSTIDARVKRGIAQAELPASKGALLAVASGVTMGNEIHWSGQ
jgi:hypothetical protein